MRSGSRTTFLMSFVNSRQLSAINITNLYNLCETLNSPHFSPKFIGKVYFNYFKMTDKQINEKDRFVHHLLYEKIANINKLRKIDLTQNKLKDASNMLLYLHRELEKDRINNITTWFYQIILLKTCSLLQHMSKYNFDRLSAINRQLSLKIQHKFEKHAEELQISALPNNHFLISGIFIYLSKKFPVIFDELLIINYKHITNKIASAGNLKFFYFLLISKSHPDESLFNLFCNEVYKHLENEQESKNIKEECRQILHISYNFAHVKLTNIYILNEITNWIIKLQLTTRELKMIISFYTNIGYMESKLLEYIKKIIKHGGREFNTFFLIFEYCRLIQNFNLVEEVPYVYKWLAQIISHDIHLINLRQIEILNILKFLVAFECYSHSESPHIFSKLFELLTSQGIMQFYPISILIYLLMNKEAPHLLNMEFVSNIHNIQEKKLISKEKTMNSIHQDIAIAVLRRLGIYRLLYIYIYIWVGYEVRINYFKWELFYSYDIYLPELNAYIEILGPSHYWYN